MELRIGWERLKWRIDNHNLLHQYEIIDNVYHVWAQDGLVVFSTSLNETEAVEYEAFYKMHANQSLDKREPETGLPKTKPRPVEGTLDMNFVYFVTGNPNSLDQGSDTCWTLDTRTAGLSKLRMTLSSGYYIDGGGIKIIAGETTSPLICALVLAPDIPSALGGNVRFVRNKKLFSTGDSTILEVPPKYVKYYTNAPAASVCELQIVHAVDDAVLIEFFLKVYR